MGRWVGEDAVFVVDYDDDDENEKRMSSTFFFFQGCRHSTSVLLR